MRALAVLPALLLAVSLAVGANALPSEQIALKGAAHQARALGPDTADYVRNAAIGNFYGIAAAKIAQAKAHSYGVRRYALMVLADNSAMEQAFATALQSDAITPPETLDPAHTILIRQLNDSAGPGFDRDYMQDEVRAQKSALNLETSYALSGRDASMRSFARELATKIRLHLALAQRVLREQNQKTASTL
jgi:putative membrane protein